MSDSQPASCPTHICQEPADDTIYSRKFDTTTLLAIRCKTLPVPISRSPRFLFIRITRSITKASSDGDKFSTEQSFLMTSVNVLHISVELTPNWLDVRILGHQFLLICEITIPLDLLCYLVVAFILTASKFVRLMEESHFASYLLTTFIALLMFLFLISQVNFWYFCYCWWFVGYP